MTIDELRTMVRNALADHLDIAGEEDAEPGQLQVAAVDGTDFMITFQTL